MSIFVCPMEAVDAVLDHHRPTHAVSLFSPGKAAAEGLVVRPDLVRLELCFHDITAPLDGHVAPSADHVRRLIGFLKRWDGKSPLLIHCWAGISRSTAAAYVAACMKRGPGAESELAQALRAAAPFATPNARIIALADEILGRNGRMMSAVAEIGRGCEAAIGSAFELRTISP